MTQTLEIFPFGIAILSGSYLQTTCKKYQVLVMCVPGIVYANFYMLDMLACSLKFVIDERKLILMLMKSLLGLFLLSELLVGIRVLGTQGNDLYLALIKVVG